MGAYASYLALASVIPTTLEYVFSLRDILIVLVGEDHALSKVEARATAATAVQRGEEWEIGRGDRKCRQFRDDDAAHS